MESEIRQQYRVIRLCLPEGTPVTVLHIGEHETAVAAGTGAELEKVLMLAIGSQRTATEFFLHTPPTPGEIENAIMQVEDEVARVKEMIAGYPALVTLDASIREIAHIACGHAGSAMQLSINAVDKSSRCLPAIHWAGPLQAQEFPTAPYSQQRF